MVYLHFVLSGVTVRQLRTLCAHLQVETETAAEAAHGLTVVICAQSVSELLLRL